MQTLKFVKPAGMAFTCLLLLAISYWAWRQPEVAMEGRAFHCVSEEGGLGEASLPPHPDWAVVSLPPGGHLLEHRANLSAWRLLVLGEQ